jgi:hypothetical protein
MKPLEPLVPLAECREDLKVAYEKVSRLRMKKGALRPEQKVTLSLTVAELIAIKMFMMKFYNE